MTRDGEAHTAPGGAADGHIVLEAGPPADPRRHPKLRGLWRLGDPALAELDLDELLDELLGRVSDALGVDTGAILLLDRDSEELVARAAKGIEEELERQVRVPLGHGFAGRIAAERVAIFVADVDRADVLNPTLSEKGIRSLLGVPLITDGQLVGVLHVGSLSHRRFDEDDVTVLQFAAARAAPAIERARLFEALQHERQVAVLLQHSLLPHRIPDCVGVSVAARYLPAGDTVGGDWYDVFELPGGRVGAAIGDVVGSGVHAAALMGQVRTALHAYAIEGHGPGPTLELVDRFVQAMGETTMATAAYAVFHPDTGALRLAAAGHLPPLVVTRAGARAIELAPAAPLGAFPYGTCPELELELRGGEILLMFTDGLVERRGEALTHGLDRLLDVVAGAASAEDACRLAIDGLGGRDGLRDDAAIVAIEHTEVPAELRARLPAEPRQLATARRLLRRWLRARGAGEELITEITLAVSEACTNAVEHAYTPGPAWFELEAALRDGEATIVVRDRGRWREPRGEHRGRGLKIIKAAMDRIEVRTGADGTEIRMRRRLE